MWEESKRAGLEAEHGPVVVIGHPDGSVFAFKRMGRAEFALRESRVARKPPDLDADEKLLQERVVWPSREVWNGYVENSGFAAEAYIAAYKELHGSKPVAPTEDGGALTNGAVTFTFRKPSRTDVRAYKRLKQAEDLTADESLLRACSTSPDFPSWLDRNLFGVGEWREAFLLANGVGDMKADAAK